jgi:broad specificity phosphatase PhoE
MEQGAGEARVATTAGVAPGAIVVVRHGRPRGDRRVKVDRAGFRDWWASYDAHGLEDGQSPPEGLLAMAGRAQVIFASSLPRAIETAHAVAQGKEVVIDPVFVEAPLPPPAIPGRRTPAQWGVWSRAAWWLGCSGGQESRRDAELRAEAAVATVTARALRGETVLLCAHGWFNRMMRPVLRAQGWRCVEDHGDSYWSYRRYEKAL